MSKIGKSLIRGAEEALVYAKGEKKNSKTYQVKIPKKNIVIDRAPEAVRSALSGNLVPRKK